MTRPDAEWIVEALQAAGLEARIVGSLAVKKQSHHDIDIVVRIVDDHTYQAYWHALERLGTRGPMRRLQLKFGSGAAGTARSLLSMSTLNNQNS